MYQVNLDEAKTHLPDLVEAVIKGEEIVITKDGQPVVKLVSVSQTKSRPQFGSAKGLISMSDDFDQPLEDFNEYMK
jgi:prevent-host-death family protein